MSVARVHFPRLQQPKAHEYVAEQIRRHIALRLIAPGESLPSERRLAAMFGVGRPTVQLALKELDERERVGREHVLVRGGEHLDGRACATAHRVRASMPSRA